MRRPWSQGPLPPHACTFRGTRRYRYIPAQRCAASSCLVVKAGVPQALPFEDWLMVFSSQQTSSVTEGLRCLVITTERANMVLDSKDSLGKVVSGIAHSSLFVQLASLDLLAVCLTLAPSHKVRGAVHHPHVLL